jgi:hypothetical protein
MKLGKILHELGLVLFASTFLIIIPIAIFIEPGAAILGTFTFIPGIIIMALGAVLGGEDAKQEDWRDNLSEGGKVNVSKSLRYKVFGQKIFIFFSFIAIILAFYFKATDSDILLTSSVFGAGVGVFIIAYARILEFLQKRKGTGA